MSKIFLKTRITPTSSNGGRIQDVMFHTNMLYEKNDKFKITIYSESVKSQSYAKLFKWSETNGWLEIISRNPFDDYGIDISYSDKYNSDNGFDKIIKDLMEFSENFRTF